MTSRNRDLSNGLFEFGLAFTLLGQAEAGEFFYLSTREMNSKQCLRSFNE